MKPSIEILLTLSELKGFGTKSIISLYNSIFCKTTNIDELVAIWSKLSKKRYKKIQEYDLRQAYKQAQATIDICKQKGIGIISYFDDDFPQNLRNCVDENGQSTPPLILYYRGNIDALKKTGVAVIGTRKPTNNGFSTSFNIAQEMAKDGYNIVSGLALGCDTAAHKGALSVNGTTTAFLANGLDWNLIFPVENLSLAHEIVDKGGLLLSEYKPGTLSDKYSFVKRDRLQAALSYATIVIQTDVNGGTMHTAKSTIASKKPLFAFQYKHKIDISNIATQGNKSLINTNAATPLSFDAITNAVNIVKRHTSKQEQEKKENKAVQLTLDL